MTNLEEKISSHFFFWTNSVQKATVLNVKHQKWLCKCCTKIPVYDRDCAWLTTIMGYFCALLRVYPMRKVGCSNPSRDKTGSNTYTTKRSATGVSVMGLRKWLLVCVLGCAVGFFVHDHVYYWDTAVIMITCRRSPVIYHYLSVKGRLLYKAAYI